VECYFTAESTDIWEIGNPKTVSESLQLGELSLEFIPLIEAVETKGESDPSSEDGEENVAEDGQSETVLEDRDSEASGDGTEDDHKAGQWETELRVSQLKTCLGMGTRIRTKRKCSATLLGAIRRNKRSGKSTKRF
jgi:hypothetical protein